MCSAVQAADSVTIKNEFVNLADTVSNFQNLNILSCPVSCPLICVGNAFWAASVLEILISDSYHTLIFANLSLPSFYAHFEAA